MDAAALLQATAAGLSKVSSMLQAERPRNVERIRACRGSAVTRHHAGKHSRVRIEASASRFASANKQLAA